MRAAYDDMTEDLGFFPDLLQSVRLKAGCSPPAIAHNNPENPQSPLRFLKKISRHERLAVD
jgi:hypothetical protein